MRVGILGAGIAGLSCAWLLKNQGIEDVIILEKNNYVGGLARSFKWHGFDCDFSAHRLFTRDEETLTQLLNLVPMGRHLRRSQIYFNGHWLRDPLDIFQLVTHASPKIGFNILRSYLTRSQNTPEDSFSSYVTKKYGSELNDFFFRPYTEKLFGVSADDISVSWAKTKVRLASPFDKYRQNTKTKFSYFYYPLHGGYGSLPNKLYETLSNNLELNATVTNIQRTEQQITGIEYIKDGETYKTNVDLLISTLPLTITSRMLGIDIPLSYQKVDAVYLLVNKPFASDNHWIYFMDGNFSVNRMVEFKNMSPHDKPADKTVLCAEVTKHCPNVVEQVINDLEKSGFLDRSEILDTHVVREDFSYPIYRKEYETVLDRVQVEFQRYSNLHIVGRAAEFKHREVDDNFAAAAEEVKKIISNIEHTTPISEPILDKPQKLKKDVWAVVLAYNNMDDTLECLESIFQSAYPNLQVVLVDNGSTDETVPTVKEQFPTVHLIENEENLWVPAGYNVGFEYALNQGADYILLLNNDTTIPENLIDILLEKGEADDSVGILMPTVSYYDEPDKIWAIGARYRKFPPAIIMQSGNGRIQNQPDFLEYAPSCGLLIKREAFERAGLFDPGYLFLNDDWDFCERVRAHGMKIKYVPEVKMLHKVSQTTKGPQSPLFWKVFGESNVRFYRRHGNPAWLSVPVHIGYIFLREFIVKGNWEFFRNFIEGVESGFKKPLGVVPAIASEATDSKGK